MGLDYLAELERVTTEMAETLAAASGAGADVTAVGGCCGLAGNFGVERGHYDVSVAIAEHDLLPAVRDAPDEKAPLLRLPSLGSTGSFAP